MPSTKGKEINIVPWDTEAEGYSVDKFYTMGGSKDRVFIRGTLPTDVHRQIAKLVQSGDFPVYETQQDFYRDAIFHRLKYLVNSYNVPTMERTLNIAEANQYMEDAQAVLAHSKKFVTDLRFMLTEMTQSGVDTHEQEFVGNILHGLPQLIQPFLNQALEILRGFYRKSELPEEVWNLYEDVRSNRWDELP